MGRRGVGEDDNIQGLPGNWKVFELVEGDTLGDDGVEGTSSLAESLTVDGDFFLKLLILHF